ncbi:ankyrin repeat domain-containing protein [Isoptericola sediminis]|uniref:Ankyrin repeat protein n=1 Tax=Isoptericola sediminis TaxID=2733572 RepID=A0A849K3P3_9MICO|nr:ankyrin repeat domain-containing protein [Isoptericola sediminis]NNU26970.1 hypothetical protein [Isoptericola sediminis]
MTADQARIALRLVELGADVNRRYELALNSQGSADIWSPVQYPPITVETWGHGTLIGQALAVHPFSKSRTGPTPLFLAVVNDSPELVDAMIAAGADPNVRTSFDETPLHWAVLFVAPRAAERLLEAGADVNARTTGKQTPWTWTQRRRHKKAREDTAEIARLLEAHGGHA